MCMRSKGLENRTADFISINWLVKNNKDAHKV